MADPFFVQCCQQLGPTRSGYCQWSMQTTNSPSKAAAAVTRTITGPRELYGITKGRFDGALSSIQSEIQRALTSLAQPSNRKTGDRMNRNQENWSRGQVVMWLHNGQILRARVIKTSLRQVKIRLIDSADVEEYWVAREYIRPLNE